MRSMLPADTVRAAFNEASRWSKLGSDMTIGVVSGLVLSALLWLFAIVYRRNFVPWYEERVYRGIDIGGVWIGELYGTFPTGEDSSQRSSISIEHHGHHLRGLAVLSPVSAGKLETRQLDFVGEIADRFVCGTLRHRGHNRIGILTVLGQVAGDGRQIEGEISYFDIVQSRIASSSFTWRKEKD